MKRYLPFIIVAAVGLITLATGVTLYRAKRSSIPAPKDATAVKEGGEALHVRGHGDAPVTLEEFGDFECPPCGKLAPQLEQIEKDYGPRLRVIFRNYPLAVHRHARAAALAAEAAGLQDRFWDMHDVLYREQELWSKADNPRLLFISYAGVIGLDVERFKKDIDGPQVNMRVAADRKRADALSVTSTPTVFINNHPLPFDQQNVIGLRKGIDAALNGTKPPADSRK
jgi:protein-disulfide isomerase